MMQKTLRILALKKVWIPLASVIILIELIGLARGPKVADYTSEKVARGPITEEVLVTGSVKPQEAVNLGFEKVGRVTSVAVKIGSHVRRGALLASLEAGSELANLQSAEAKLRGEEARLADLKAGARPEEIAVTEADLSVAQQSLANAYSDVSTTLQDALNKAENAVHVELDTLFDQDEFDPKLTFETSDSKAKQGAEAGRRDANTTLATLKNTIESLSSSETEREAALQSAVTKYAALQVFLGNVSAALDNSVSFSASTIAAYKTHVSTARTNITAAQTSVSDLTQSIADKKIAIQKIQRSLALQKLGATDDAVKEEEAVVDQARASVLSAKSAYAKNFLYAPTAGVITAKNVLAGQIVSGNSDLFTLQTDQSFELQADIPEADIASIHIGDTASTTLDAYGDDVVFTAVVTSIDPAEKIIESVPTYRITLDFSKPDSRIRSGMTANITITTASRDSALSIPQRALIEKDAGVKIVRVVRADGSLEERTVTTGIRGSNGEIEILSGIKENETVVTFLKQ